MMKGDFGIGRLNSRHAALDIPSTWLAAPYFLLYFTMYTLNTLIWPLQLMERACMDLLPQDKELIPKSLFKMKFYQPANSCIATYINSNGNGSDVHHANDTNTVTLNIMMIAAFGSGILSLLSYFLIWKPLLTKCRSVAIFVPPLCAICQSILLAYAQEVASLTTFKYTIVSAVMIPSIHCNFQGVLLLVYHMTEIPEVNGKGKREIKTIRLEWSHGVMFLSIVCGGYFINACFDLSYYLIFFIQFSIGCVDILYAFTLIPTDCTCWNEEVEEVVDGNSDDIECMSSSDEDEGINLLSKPVDLLKEAPLIFSETSYKKELIVIIEITVFTVATVADIGISGPYLIQQPILLDLKAYGHCIAAQGVIRVAGMILVKFLTHYKQFKHGSLICLAALNYIAYYVALSLASTKVLVIVLMFSNIFGGLAFPTLFSFMKLNLRDTVDAVLEIATLSSLVITMAYTCLEYFIYEQTRIVFPGAIFALTASVIAISIIIILATYLSTTIKNQRKTKHFTDKLMNNYH